MMVLLILFMSTLVAVAGWILIHSNTSLSLEWLGGIEDDLPNFKKEIKDLLMLFAADSGEKTEKPSQKKLEDAKKKGQTPKSQDVGVAVSLLVSFGLLLVFGETFIEEIKSVMVLFIEQSTNTSVSSNPTQLNSIFISIFFKFFLLLFVPIMIVGVVVNVAQTGFVLTGEHIKPKFSKINPINGFKDMFSQRRLFDFLKNLTKLIIVFAIAYNFVMDRQGVVSELPYLEVNQALALFGNFVQEMFTLILGVVIVIAVVDYAYQRYDFLKKQRMTKQEVKEEYKQAEGDPHIKGMRRQRQRELARNRMMQAIPEATVVVTNPTHFAVAIKYDEKEAPIPKVVAKGSNLLALRIKEIAKEHDIIIVENKPLARTLFKVAEVDREIPVEMFKAVADLLVLVYRLERKRKFR